MIFVNTGTQLPFDRLVSSVDSWAAKQKGINLFGQIGNAKYLPRNFGFVDFLPYVDFESYFKKADLIVAHAGMGNIIRAIVDCKPIIIMPRRANLCEHRNNHQQGTSEKFKNKSNVYVAQNEEEMHLLLEKFVLNKLNIENSESNEVSINLTQSIISFIDSTKRLK
jgi:UDP-N-acetylglucosamine transferase subunit ALG13